MRRDNILWENHEDNNLLLSCLFLSILGGQCHFTCGYDCTNTHKKNSRTNTNTMTKIIYKYSIIRWCLMPPRYHLLTGSCDCCAPLKPRHIPSQDVHDHLRVGIWSQNDQWSRLWLMVTYSWAHCYHKIINNQPFSVHISIITVSAMSSALWPVTILFTPSWNRNI